MKAKNHLICCPLVLWLAVCAASAQSVPATLKDAFKNDFLIGAAINQPQFF